MKQTKPKTNKQSRQARDRFVERINSGNQAF